jgi:hypothetical protein
MQNRGCLAARRDGTPCRAPASAIGPDGFCWAHSPATLAERRAARSKGGRQRATAARLDRLVPATLRPMISTLLGALDEVHAGSLDPRAASAMAALAGAIARAYGVGVLEERVAELERATAREAGRA